MAHGLLLVFAELGSLSHFKGLLERIPPDEITKSALRRVWRRARKAIYRPPLPGATLQKVRADFANGAPLAEKLFENKRLNLFCDVARRPSVLEAVAQMPSVRARAEARAKRALSKEYDIFGIGLSLGREGKTPWHRDALTGHVFPLCPAREIDALAGGFDAKYAWALGRLGHLVSLGQGYWLCPTEGDFVSAFVAEVNDFLQHNPTGMGIHWVSPLEVALRACNLAVALRMFSDHSQVRDEAFLLPVAAALVEHLEFVEAHLEDEGAVPNNHLLANAVGLWVVAALFPALPDMTRRRARTGRMLSRLVHSQVNADGTSFENSIGYHLWVAELLTLAFASAGEAASAPFSGRLKAMFSWPSFYCSESGLAPQLGDNDSSRALPFCDRPSAYHGHLPSLGAVLFKEEVFKREGDVLSDEAVWLLGNAAIERWEALAPRAKEGSGVSEAGGWAVLRGASSVVTASIGGNGQRGVGGHSHRDKLSFELHRRGMRIIADPGSPSYGRDWALRRAYRSTLVHNGLALDGEEMAPLSVERPFSMPAELRAGVEHFSDSAETAELCASHFGYRRLAAPAVVRRRWVLGKKEGFLSICDWVVGVGTHEARVALMIPGREVSMRKPSAPELERASTAVASEVLWAGAAAQVSNSAVILFSEPFAVSMVQTQYSPGYGELASAQEIRADARVKGPARLQWIVLFID